VLTQSPHAITCKPPCVSVLRPSRKVTAPDGTEWELYVSRFALPPWRPARYTGSDPITSAPFELVLFLLSIPIFLVEQVAWPLLRFVLELPGAAVRARRTRTATGEAICFSPRKVSLVWTTSDDHSDRVLAQIADALIAGEQPQPLGARFAGRVEN
jgi:hypothetical protein